MTDIRAAERIAMRPAKYKGKKVSMDGVELLRGPYSVEAEAAAAMGLKIGDVVKMDAMLRDAETNERVYFDVYGQDEMGDWLMELGKKLRGKHIALKGELIFGVTHETYFAEDESYDKPEVHWGVLLEEAEADDDEFAELVARFAREQAQAQKNPYACRAESECGVIPGGLFACLHKKENEE